MKFGSLKIIIRSLGSTNDSAARRQGKRRKDMMDHSKKYEEAKSKLAARLELAGVLFKEFELRDEPANIVQDATEAVEAGDYEKAAKRLFKAYGMLGRFLQRQFAQAPTRFEKPLRDLGRMAYSDASAAEQAAKEFAEHVSGENFDLTVAAEKYESLQDLLDGSFLDARTKQRQESERAELARERANRREADDLAKLAKSAARRRRDVPATATAGRGMAEQLSA